MFGGGKGKGLFDHIPDIDGNGEHDILDMLILDDILTEEEKADESVLSDDDWRLTCEDGSEYGIDPEDYNDEEEYMEALEDAKAQFDTTRLNVSFTIGSESSDEKNAQQTDGITARRNAAIESIWILDARMPKALRFLYSWGQGRFANRESCRLI